METITITTEFIKLQDLLKLSGLVYTGGEAKVHPGGCCHRQRRGLHPAG